MSTTSVAVVYAVMLEFGFNVTDYGKTVLAACFITDLGTVVSRTRRNIMRSCWFQRLLVGSVTKQVMHYAYCPVLVVR